MAKLKTKNPKKWLNVSMPKFGIFVTPLLRYPVTPLLRHLGVVVICVLMLLSGVICVCALTASPLDGSTQTKAGASCKTIKEDVSSSTDGVYWIDPNGGDISDAFQAYCDMTTDGGGWTLVGFQGSDVQSDEIFSRHGVVQTDFSEGQSSAEWSLKLDDNQINDGTGYSEIVITMEENENRIQAYSKTYFFRFDVPGGYRMDSSWNNHVESGGFEYKCAAVDPYTSSAGWSTDGGTRSSAWYPLTGPQCDHCDPPGGGNLAQVFPHHDFQGFLDGGGCPLGTNSKNRSAYIWVR